MKSVVTKTESVHTKKELVVTKTESMMTKINQLSQNCSVMYCYDHNVQLWCLTHIGRKTTLTLLFREWNVF